MKSDVTIGHGASHLVMQPLETVPQRLGRNVRQKCLANSRLLAKQNCSGRPTLQQPAMLDYERHGEHRCKHLQRAARVTVQTAIHNTL
jgi:hypothetical protein